MEFGSAVIDPRCMQQGKARHVPLGSG